MKHWQLKENQPLLGQIYKEPPIIVQMWKVSKGYTHKRQTLSEKL